MSLNNIQLQDFIIGELYKDALLVSPDGAPAIQRPLPAAGTTVPAAAVSPAPAPATAPAQPAVAPPVAPPVSSIPPAPVSAPTQPKAPAAPAPVTGQSVTGQAASTPAANLASTNTAPPAAAAYKFLGNNRRNVTILVNAPGSPFLPDNQLNFLTKILEACRMNIGDVAIVNHATSPIVINALREQLQPSSILLFGLEPTAIRLPISFPTFKLQPYDQCTYLSAPGLELMVATSEESKLLKSKLWVCLKTLFNV